MDQENNLKEWIQCLQTEYSPPDGVVWNARKGRFDPQRAAIFVKRLQGIRIPLDAPMDRRLVSLLWYLPLILEWQVERIRNNGGDLEKYQQFESRVLGIVEEILGVP